MNKYRVSELARILGISDVAIRKRIKHGEFKTVKELYNKRTITFVCLNDSQIKELKIETNKPLASNDLSSSVQNEDIKELITNCIEKYENFYSEYLDRITDLNRENANLIEENAKLKAQLSSVIAKYNGLAKRINAGLAKKGN